MQKVKICGLTKKEEAAWLLEEQTDYAGFVLFFPKSKRNNTIEQAKDILSVFDEAKKKGQDIQTVAVTVSPRIEQAKAVKEAGFDLIQIHGQLEETMLKACPLPVIRAIHDKKDWKQFLEWDCKPEYREKLVGILFDAKEPGSGETFDWNTLEGLEEFARYRKEKIFFIAGGLTPENVKKAIDTVNPDVVDVSSGVEFSKEEVGKDREKIKAFMHAAKQ